VRAASPTSSTNKLEVLSEEIHVRSNMAVLISMLAMSFSLGGVEVGHHAVVTKHERTIAALMRSGVPSRDRIDHRRQAGLRCQRHREACEGGHARALSPSW
jgi:hypothetical protein